MSNQQRLILGVVALLLVGLGLTLLRSNDGGPTPEEVPSPSVSAAPAVAPEGVPANAPRAEPRGLDAADAAVSPGAAVLEPAVPEAPTAPSPYDDPGSEELQYAAKLVLEPHTGPREWHKAAEVFQRCVDASPFNHLCKRGVRAAWERIDSDGGMPTALTKQVYSVQPRALPSSTPEERFAPAIELRNK